MKEKLTSALGTFGIVLWLVLSFLFICIPVWATNFSWPIMLLIFAVLFFTDVIGSLLTVVVYIYSTFVILSGPMDWFAIVFFVDLALYLIFSFFPAVANIIGTYRANHR